MCNLSNFFLRVDKFFVRDVLRPMCLAVGCLLPQPSFLNSTSSRFNILGRSQITKHKTHNSKLPTMEPDDYPTVESTNFVFDLDKILGPIHRSLDYLDDGGLSLAQEAQRAARASNFSISQAVGKLEKVETPFEIWTRVSSVKQSKAVKSVKTTAKKSVRQKKIYKMSSYYKQSKK
jgi:hypothetical protein